MVSDVLLKVLVNLFTIRSILFLNQYGHKKQITNVIQNEKTYSSLGWGHKYLWKDEIIALKRLERYLSGKIACWS